MNYCPECGSRVSLDKVVPDVATNHYNFTCAANGHEWVETLTKGGELVHIAPAETEEEGGS